MEENRGIRFQRLHKNSLPSAARLAVDAFGEYEYFTNWFPDKNERDRVMYEIILHEYKTNFRRARYLAAVDGGTIVAVAQLNPPEYKKPSALGYLLHGWLDVYRAGDRKRIDDWLAMDAEAGRPCHEYQETGPGIWYASSLTVAPFEQGTGIGTKFLHFWEKYVRMHGGREIVFFTNSEKNLAFYKKRGYEVFHERVFEHDGKTMGSWSLKKAVSDRI